MHYSPVIVVLSGLEKYMEKEGMGFVDVSSKRFFNERQLNFRLSCQQRDQLKDAQKRWSEDTKSLRNWKELVKMSRTLNVSPEEVHVYNRILHVPSLTKVTDVGEEPIPDKDGWIQYCVARDFGPDCCVGDAKLFVEFPINLFEWCDPLDVDLVQKQMTKDVEGVWHNEHKPLPMDAAEGQRQEARARASADIQDTIMEV